MAKAKLLPEANPAPREWPKGHLLIGKISCAVYLTTETAGPQDTYVNVMSLCSGSITDLQCCDLEALPKGKEIVLTQE